MSVHKALLVEVDCPEVPVLPASRVSQNCPAINSCSAISLSHRRAMSCESFENPNSSAGDCVLLPSFSLWARLNGTYNLRVKISLFLSTVLVVGCQVLMGCSTGPNVSTHFFGALRETPERVKTNNVPHFALMESSSIYLFKGKLRTPELRGSWGFSNSAWLCVDAIVAPRFIVSAIQVRGIDEISKPALSVLGARATLLQAGEYRVHVDGDALPAWFEAHGAAIRKLQRQHLGLTAPTYSAEYRGGSTSSFLSRSVLKELLWKEQEMRVGWRWEELTGVFAMYDFDSKSGRPKTIDSRRWIGNRVASPRGSWVASRCPQEPMAPWFDA